MIATAVEFYNVVVFVHVLAVVVGLGPTFAYGAFLAVAGREGGAALPTVGRAVMLWDRTANTIGLVVILLTGLYLVSDGPWELSDFFVSWGLVTILFLFGMVHGYFIPKTRALVEAAERDLDSPAADGSSEADASGETSRSGVPSPASWSS